MKMKTLSAGLLALSLCAPLAGQGKKLVGLPGGARTWLEEEVVYIITPKERDVFLKLASDKERDIFIDAFWKQRDPTPGTPKNEFREEHYRRIGYANRMLGRGTPTPGLEDRPREDLYPAGRAQEHRAVRHDIERLPDRDLVVPRRSRPGPADGLQRHLLQGARDRGLHPLFAHPARPRGPDRPECRDGRQFPRREDRLRGAEEARPEPGLPNPFPHSRRAKHARLAVAGLQHPHRATSTPCPGRRSRTPTPTPS